MILRALRRRLHRWRSDITGRFVSKGYAADHPDTTVSVDAVGEQAERDRNLREEHYP